MAKGLYGAMSTELQDYVSSLLTAYRFDHVLFDHFTAFAFIKNFKTLRELNVVYIAHNVESKVLADQYKLNRNTIKRMFYYTEYIKTKCVEKEILANTAVTITISSEDKGILQKGFAIGGIIKNIPEILPLQNDLWKYKPGKNILFVGGIDYYPNYDAVDWIVFKLMPELIKIDESIICTIVGNADGFKQKNLPANIVFTGRISDDDLEYLYKSANLFISPVVLGSGIKVKVLTALSYCIPLLCTKESMHGIDYIENQERLIFGRNSLSHAVSKVMALLNDKNNQTQVSSLIEENMKKSLKAISDKWNLNND